jgi:hypothetical protein
MSISIHRLPLMKVLFALAIVSVGALGFIAVHHIMTKSSSPVASTTPAQSSTQQSVAPAVGTTASIDALTTADAASEASINTKYEQADQTSVDTTNKAAAGVEGAFDESTY